ncbi:bifunctional metallophosphatase/5'-nucleotidase [Streptomyces netropsis]|uniref:bifunctional metallophosphatase/5'-nucleotidase n=1 Tax=Streptomyces netropsis TaxID=55404 RepID=UPI0037B6A6D7
MAAVLMLVGVAAVGPAPAAGGAGPVQVQLLSITDFHGYLQPPGLREGGVVSGQGGSAVTVGGAAYLAAHIKRLRAGHANSVLFAAGDSFSGWPFEAAAHADEPTIEILNALGLRFSAVGNHELDVSPSFLADHMQRGICQGAIGADDCFTDSTGRRFHGADFEFLSGNIVSAATGSPVTAPYRVEWFTGEDGARTPVGFIGMTVPGTPTGSTSYQPRLRGLDVVDTTNAYAAVLRARGVRAMVLILHEGARPRNAAVSYDGCGDVAGPAMDIARRVSPDIDAVVTGHWHAGFNCTVTDPAGSPRPVVEAGHHGGLVNEMNLLLEPATGEVLREHTVSVNHPVTRDVPPDPRVQHIVNYWTAQGARRYAQPLGTQAGSFLRAPNAAGESTAADLYADVQYWDANRTRAGRADLALLAVDPPASPTAVRTDLPYAKGTHPADTDGRILLGEAWNAYGYHNPILTVTLTGAQLKAVLEQQWRTTTEGITTTRLAVSHNVRYAYDPTRPAGDRISPADILINAQHLNLTRSYRVAALAYTILGADGFSAFTSYTNPFRNHTDHTAFTAYLQTHPHITPAPLNRTHIKLSYSLLH